MRSRRAEKFFVAMMLLVVAMLYTHVDRQEQVFLESQSTLMKSAAKATARTVHQFIAIRRLEVEVFSDDFSAEIDDLAKHPDDLDRVDAFDTKIKRHFPSAFAFTIVDSSGDPIVEDIEGSVGEACKVDIKSFITRNSNVSIPTQAHLQTIQIHPQANHYHFDILIPMGSNGGAFFVSFEASSLRQALLKSGLSDYHTYLLRTDKPGLIEVSDEGVRDTLDRDIFLSEEELERAGSAMPVLSTLWQVVLIPRPELFAALHKQLVTEAVVVMGVVFIIGLVLLLLSQQSEMGRFRTYKKLVATNSKLEARSGELTLAVEELKEAKTELQLCADELKNSNQELEQFAYIASHDLQEPLRTVSSYLELLALRYKGKLDDDADTFIDFAVDGSTRMRTLINDLLEYSRVGTRGAAMETVDSAQAVEEVLSDLSVLMKEADARVEVGALPDVQADSGELRRLFQNLIGNALKYRGDARPHICIGAMQVGESWQYSIADNGIGIRADFFERVFVLFQRLHTRETYSGTGLGLAVCKKIVERHGGRIWVESIEGEGSTFSFT